MDSFEYNKIVGALLGTVFVVFSIALLSDNIFSTPNPEKPGFVIKADEVASASSAKPAAPVEIAPLLAKADPKKGAEIFHRCEACHDGTKGGPNKVGPNLWGVVGRPIASHPGYSYSAAMKKFSDDSKKHWTFQLISEFITSPRKEVPGTAMGFIGLPDAQDRANVLSYLRTLSDNPEPLPTPEAPKPAAASAKAPADGKAPANGAGAPKGAPAKTPASGGGNGQGSSGGAQAPGSSNVQSGTTGANGQAPAQGTAPKAPAPAK